MLRAELTPSWQRGCYRTAARVWGPLGSLPLCSGRFFDSSRHLVVLEAFGLPCLGLSSGAGKVLGSLWQVDWGLGTFGVKCQLLLLS